jgi:hypothetical protein
MFVHSFLATLAVQIVVFCFGLHLGRSERKLQRGLGVALQILSVVVIVIDMLRRAMMD